MIILMTSPQQEQSQESSQTDQQQELELLSMTVEQINTISVSYTHLTNLNSPLSWDNMNVTATEG